MWLGQERARVVVLVWGRRQLTPASLNHTIREHSLPPASPAVTKDALPRPLSRGYYNRDANGFNCSGSLTGVINMSLGAADLLAAEARDKDDGFARTMT